MVGVGNKYWRKGFKLSLIFILCIIIGTSGCCAGDPYESFKKNAEEEYSQFKQEAESEYLEFRKKADLEYAEFLKKRWEEVKIEQIVNAPVVEPPFPYNLKPEPSVVPHKLNTDPIVITIEPQQKPEPLCKIVPERLPKEKDLGITFFGATISLKGPKELNIYLRETTEKGISDAWKELATSKIGGLLEGLDNERDLMKLPDWGFVQLCDKVAQKYYSAKTSEHALLMGYLLIQSGFKIRFAIDASEKIHILLSTRGLLFGRSYYGSESDERYYPYEKELKGMMRISKAPYPGERCMRLGITQTPQFPNLPQPPRVIKAHADSRFTLGVSVNKNLIDFYQEYPECALSGDVLSKWKVQADTPASQQLRQFLYPVLRKRISGNEELDAVGILLDFCQSFPYGRDDEIWGHDRAFWPDESWAYPLSDCEDHAIHFSRLVRDLTQLPVVLLYYPNHLAAAVAFTDNVPGDYVVYNSRKYTVCDPTIFYGKVGQSMQGCRSMSAKVIPLDR